MDSKADSSLPTLLITYNLVETGSKNLRRGRSAYTTWVHTRTARDGENSWHKFCIHCTVTPPYSTSVSTNMRGYLKLKHGIYVNRTPGPV